MNISAQLETQKRAENVRRVHNHEFSMTIAGKPVNTAETFQVSNPATEEILATAPICGVHDLDKAMASAERAFEVWRRTDVEHRRRTLQTIANIFEEHTEILATIATLEQGKPYVESVADVARSADWIRYFADLPLGDQIIQDDEFGFVEVVHRPLGVVAAVLPWNQPMLMVAWKLAPALLAGNSIVLKPSSTTPLTALYCAELLRDALPEGLVSCLSGPEPLGSNLVEHPSVAKVSFTGSTEVGKGIASVTAGDLKRLTLELGGNDAAIVLDDADPSEFAQQLFWAAFKNNGQMCALVKRLFVPENRRNDWVEAIAEVARSVVIGDGMVDGTELGPITTTSQYRSLLALEQETRTSGARVLDGGQRLPSAGYFFAPRIVTDVDDSSRIVAEEQFGPMLPIVGYDDLEVAVHRANNTKFGLGGSVWGSDVERARQVAARLESGHASVNHHTRGILPHLPFGGAKWSGIGAENGPWGLAEYTQLQTVAGPSRSQL